MILFDLRCTLGDHQFEGWFGSRDDFDDQKARGLLCCPFCGSDDVEKALSAPRLARKGNQLVSSSSGRPKASDAAADGPNAAGRAMAMAPAPEEIPPRVREALARMAEHQAEIIKQSEWVGDRFGEEARAIHYGEKDARMIHGQTTPDEARALHEEGVPVAPLLIPVIPPQAKN